jgi:membrane dipeptidase
MNDSVDGGEMDGDQARFIVIDGHQDLAYNRLAFGRDYVRSALVTRAAEKGGPVPATNGSCMIGLPELFAGNVAVVFGTVFTMPARRRSSALDVFYYDIQEAHQQAIAQLDVYHRWADEESTIVLVENAAELQDVLAAWQSDAVLEEPEERRVGVVLLMENAEPVREPAELELWVERGVRIVGPAWTSNRYTGGTGDPRGLTDLGRELLEVMADLGIGLDVSHMAEDAALEALDRFEGILMASHSNPRGIVPGDRQISDSVISGIAERDGVIGISPYNGFLLPDWRRGDRKERITLTDVVRAIDYVCQRVGDAEHVGLGSDFDGGFGSESVPDGMDTVADIGKIATVLAEHGYEQKHIAQIMSGNWERILRRLLT